MAKRGVPLNPGYKPGSHWAVCDYCGFQFRSEDLRENWEGFWVCNEDYETRHPQEFLRVKEEKIAADQPLRADDTSSVIDVSFRNVITRNVANMTYDSVSLDVSNEIVSSFVLSAIFSSDGTKLYVMDSGNGDIYQYNLSTAWDLSTATYSTNSFSPTGNTVGIQLKSDGLVLFSMDTSEIIRTYTLSTAFDISTAVATGDTFDLGAPTGSTQGADFAFNGDGTVLYYLDSTSVDSLYQFSLSVAYDITTLSYTGKEFDVTTTLGVNPTCVFYTSTEPFAMWLTESAADTVQEYDLPDTNDITTLSAVGNSFTFNGTPTISFLGGIFIADDKLYAFGNTIIYQFTLPARATRAIDNIPAGDNDNSL